MRQTKLIEALQSMNAREISRWRQYVYSDFCNRHRHLRSLCDLFVAASPQFDALPGKPQAFAQIFGPDTPYHELKFNNLLSDLYELLLDWLALEHFWSDALEQQQRRVQALLARNLNRHAVAAQERYLALLRQMPQRNAEWYSHAAAAEQAAETLHSRQPRRADSPHLAFQSQYTHVAHALEKLRLALALKSRAQLAVIQAEANEALAPAINAIRHDTALLHETPVAQTYLAAIDLLEKPTPEMFGQLKSALEKSHLLLGKEEISALYHCALNYCIRRINAGESAANTDAMALYRTLLERGLLTQQGGRISQWTYKNIATTGLRTGEYDWTELFLHQYRNALPPNERDNAFAYNIAALYFERRQFQEALQTLLNVEFTDLSYHLGAKNLQLKTFFHLREWGALHSLLDATAQLLRRDKTLSPFGKATNLNFLRALRLVSKWERKKERLPVKKFGMERAVLAAKIERMNPLANKDWVEKVLET